MLVNPDYYGNVILYNKPGGKILIALKNDSVKEDYLVFSVDADTGNYFHVTIQHGISGKYSKGWLKKENNIGTYVRNYDDSKLFFIQVQINNQK